MKYTATTMGTRSAMRGKTFFFYFAARYSAALMLDKKKPYTSLFLLYLNQMVIRGSALLDESPEDLKKQHGFNIIHQTWKNETIPKKEMKNYKSWPKHHPNAYIVLWTDEDNLKLVEKFYPEYLSTYNGLKLPIQKVDMVRLMYLHRYGGIYADMDYEARQNIVKYFPQPLGDVMIVESPVLLNEVMQNSLMVATTLYHPFWKACLDSIREIVSFINSPEACKVNKWGGCELLQFFHNPLTSKMSNMLFTLYITGPTVLDKTWLRSRDKNWNLKLLPKERFFVGDVAVHHQSNSWVNVPKAMPELISLCVIVYILIIAISIVVCILFFRKRRLKMMMT